MSGLSLIGTYSSDSEDDDEVSRKSLNGFVEPTNCVQTLPLPRCILSWKGVEHQKEVKDDPLEHEGRTRSFKHERGNWATLVFAQYLPDEPVKNWMKSVSSELPVQGNYLFQQFHLSLTRTLILKFHWIESFVDSVKELCRKIQRFTIELRDVKVYCNDERTRTFLAIRCETRNKALEKITSGLDKILAEFQLPPFYKDASFHVSFMWNHGDVESRLKPFVPSLTMTLANVLLENSGFQIPINELHCKIGNKTYAFHLK